MRYERELAAVDVANTNQHSEKVLNDDLVSRALQLSSSCPSWFGGSEDGEWAEVIPFVADCFDRDKFIAK